MNRWKPIGGLVVLALLAAGCGSGSDSAATPAPTVATTVPPGGTLSVAVTDALPVAGWDPLTAPDSTVRTLGPLVMATLLRPANDGAAPEAGLASSVTADSKATAWTITLRSGLTFADGTALTAKDMAFALTEAAKAPQLAGRFGADAKGTFFVSATASGATTLVVNLRAPNALLDRTVLAAPEFGCIKDDYAGLTREKYYRDPPSCGPYVPEPFAESASSTMPLELTLKRNPTYYAPDRVGPTTITVMSVFNGPTNCPQPDERARSFIASGGDVFIDPRLTEGAAGSSTASPSAVATPIRTATATPSATDEVSQGQTVDAICDQRSGGTLVRASGPGRVSVLLFRSRPPARDSNVRIAVQASLNLKVLEGAVTGASAPTSGLVPNDWPGSSVYTLPAPDAALAKTAASLVPKSRRTLRLLVRAGNAEAVAQARLIAAQVAPSGITVKVDASSGARYERALASGGFQAAMVTMAPRVAVAADATREWAVTGGLGGGWPIQVPTTAYPGQLALPALGASALKAGAAFNAAVLDPLQAIPLTVRPYAVLASPKALNGLAVRWDGSVPLERVALAASPTAS